MPDLGEDGASSEEVAEYINTTYKVRFRKETEWTELKNSDFETAIIAMHLSETEWQLFTKSGGLCYKFEARRNVKLIGHAMGVKSASHSGVELINSWGRLAALPVLDLSSFVTLKCYFIVYFK